MATSAELKEMVYTVFNFFCGIGGGALGFQEARAQFRGVPGKFRNLGGIDSDPLACKDFEMLTGVPATCMDLFSREQYIAFHGKNPPAEWREATVDDIRQAAQGESPDVIFLSPPCLPGHVPVLTPEGLEPIGKMRAGRQVLSHKGRYRKISKVGSYIYNGTIYGVRLNGTVDVQEFTSEHPIWRRKVIRTVAASKKRALGSPEFVRADQLRVGDRVGFPIEPEVKGCANKFAVSLGDPKAIHKVGRKSGRYSKSDHNAISGRTIDLSRFVESVDLWFLVGAYLGDGYRRASRHEVIFCVGASDGDFAENVRSSLRALGLSFFEDNNGGPGNIKLRAHGIHLCRILGAFGDGAHRKDIPAVLMGLEKNLLKAMVGGYRSSDGTESGRRIAKNELQARWRIPSVSLPLLRSMQRLLLRLGEFASIHQAWPGGEQVIMGGRKVNTRPRWELNVRLDPKKRTVYEFEDGAVWVRVRSIKSREAKERVWNLEVEEDNTFCVPMIATHNCKGFSGLLPTKNASSPKYQALNQLTVRGLKLAMEAFEGDLPFLLLLENVPRISSARGAHLLAQIRELLESYGYVINEGHHDCGEIGGLGQHRRRFLLIARNVKKLKNFVYKPPKLRVKSIGEIVGELPMPDDPAAGPMHRLPRLQWITWLRLALIPPSGDHRDLAAYGPGKTQYNIVPVGEAGPPAEVFDTPVLGYQPRGGGAYGVQDWEKPASTVLGNSRVNGSNAAAIADVRLRQTASRYTNKYQVVSWNETSPCITGTPDVQAGTPSVADVRVPEKANRHHSHYRVVKWGDACGTVTGATHVANGAACVADVRVSDKSGSGYNGSPGLYGVIDWNKPAPTISGNARVSSSNCPSAVADPRPGQSRAGTYGVVPWDEPMGTISGSMAVNRSNCPAAVADPMIRCKQRNTAYGVQGWDKPANTVTGTGDIHSTAAAVADPRVPQCDDIPEPPPVIISADGSWHRPVTTLELAVLQSLPPVLPDGRPLVLAGRSEGKWRERIGNMVPKEAGKAIAYQILMALIPNSMGQWVLGSTEIWVKRREDVQEISQFSSLYRSVSFHICSGPDRFGTA